MRSRKNAKAAAVRRRRILWILAAFLFLLVCITIAGTVIFMRVNEKRSLDRISTQVESFRPQIEKYAEEAGISGYENYLLAIMQIESGGWGKDVMQSSESLGLPRNTLDTEESIKQGCLYLAENIARAEKLGCDTLSAVQAYNFGIDYLDFVAERGGVQTVEIAEEFAKMRSGGATVDYSNRVAREYNGGYRYRYGNMFYAELVRRLVEGENG